MKRKIKLLYVIGTLDVGGSEGQLVQLVKRLNPQRFEAVVCCLASGGPYLGALDTAGVQVEVVGFRGFRIFHRV